MAFDECPSSVASRDYIENSVARTARWLKRCRKEMNRLNGLEDTIKQKSDAFWNQPRVGYMHDVRIEHAKAISDIDLDGYAIGGLAVGESHAEMYHVLLKR